MARPHASRGRCLFGGRDHRVQVRQVRKPRQVKGLVNLRAQVDRLARSSTPEGDERLAAFSRRRIGLLVNSGDGGRQVAQFGSANDRLLVVALEPFVVRKSASGQNGVLRAERTFEDLEDVPWVEDIRLRVDDALQRGAIEWVEPKPSDSPNAS